MGHMFICVCREGHERGFCWNGGFNISHVMVGDGHVRISSSIASKKYTPEGGRADYDQLYKILLVFVDPLGWKFPLHMKYLLMTLRKANNSMMRDPDFITFLINHPCLLSFAERNRLYCLVDQMIHKLPLDVKSYIVQIVEDAGIGYDGWYAIVVSVLEFEATFMHGATPGINGPVPLYGTPLADGFHLGHNFLKHTAIWVSNSHLLIKYL